MPNKPTTRPTTPAGRRAATFKAILRAIAIILFAGAVFAWILYTPYAPERLYRPIPPEATALVTFDNLASDLDTIVQNPLLTNAYTNLRQDLLNFGTDIDSPETRKWLRRFTSKRTVAAYVPAMGVSGAPAVILTTWGGTYCRLLRWYLSLTRPRQIDVLEHSGPRHLWCFRSGSGKMLSFTIDNGMLIVCISEDYSAIHFAASSCDGTMPSILDVPDLKHQFTAIRPDKTPCVYGVVQTREHLPAFLPASFRFDIYRTDAAGLCGAVMPEQETFSCPSILWRPDTCGLEQVIGNAPSAMFLAGANLADKLDDSSADTLKDLTTTLLELTSRNHAETISLGLFTGEYSGKIGRPPIQPTVPSLMLFLHTKKMAGTIEMMQSILDGINARHQLGLIVNPEGVSVGDYSVFAIESTSGNLFSYADPEDLPGFVQVGDWTIISSNIRGLIKLTAHAQTAAVKREAVNCEWAKDMGGFPFCMYSWIDTKDGGKAFQVILAAYSFTLMGKSDPGSLAVIRQIRTVREWLDIMQEFEYCRLWVDMESGKPILSFDLGIPGASPGTKE